MEAFGIQVHHTDKINFQNFYYFEKHELFVSANGRLVQMANGVLLESKELSEHYKDAITTRRMKAGDSQFDAEVVRVSSLSPDSFESVKKDSEVMREKLEAWNYLTPQNITINDNGWVIRVQHEDKEQPLYLMTLGKDGSIRLCQNKDTAKTYKRSEFVQKALKEINKNPKLKRLQRKLNKKAMFAFPFEARPTRDKTIPICSFLYVIMTFIKYIKRGPT